MYLWNTFAAQQLRVDFGQVYGLDLGAIAIVFKIIEVDDIQWQLEMMNIIFKALYGEKEK